MISVDGTFYRQDAAKRQTACIKFTHRPKIIIFAPQGRLVQPIHMKFGTAEANVGLLGCAELHANQCPGWERGPKMAKNPLFGTVSLRRGEPFELQCLGTFIRPTILY